MSLGREKCWAERWTGAGDKLEIMQKGWEGDVLAKERDWGGRWVVDAEGWGA